MSYAELLQTHIRKSGWSMREISRRCSERGENVSQAYLSKLSSGKAPPASDKVNMVIGEVLSIVTDLKEDDLLLASYKEKIPPDIIRKLSEQLD